MFGIILTLTWILICILWFLTGYEKGYIDGKIKAYKEIRKQMQVRNRRERQTLLNRRRL